MSVAARLVALVNRYDNLCRPANAERAMTPHDAMSQLFSQGQKRYDPALLSTFVRMMGVYPPGSVVQLTDDRYAVVESVSARVRSSPRCRCTIPPAARNRRR
jgi:HD-GYP domain-containing protein (c-di-GMP phosphodiesterase class II)